MTSTTHTIFAPAKINLGLRITGRYADGYHHLETLFAPVTLYDRLRLNDAAQTSIRYHWDFAQNTSERQKLCHGVMEHPLLWKSIAMAERFATPCSLRIHVHKRIPSPAGLGGASSDAAALIAHLACATHLDEIPETLTHKASALGSDIPYFLQHGLWGEAAYLSGTGRELRRVVLQDFVGFLIHPPFGFSTGRMFRYFAEKPLPVLQKTSPPKQDQPKGDYSHSANPNYALRLTEIPYSDEPFTGIRHLANDFEEAAEAVHPEAAEVLREARERAARYVHSFLPAVWLTGLSGSGATLFAITEKTGEQKQGRRAFVAAAKHLEHQLGHRLLSGGRWRVSAIENHRRW